MPSHRARLDPHARPPDALRAQYKHYQKAPPAVLLSDPRVFDARRASFAGCSPPPPPPQSPSPHLPPDVAAVFSRFLDAPAAQSPAPAPAPAPTPAPAPAPAAYAHPRVPGLFIFPSVLPRQVQLSLLDRLLHRDLSRPSHRTNLHAHYDVAYPPAPAPSFFSSRARSLVHPPKDARLHKPLPAASALNRRLRWVTLGGQYDWSDKLYPPSPPPPFPADVAALVEGLFPCMSAQAAIVNLYTPADTLSLHRDVSEECDRPLVSISLGCDAIFVAGLEGQDALVVRLASGDAVVMSGEARYAWHGVPQVVADTCPAWMADWPYVADAAEGEDDYECWRGWMQRKRINLNVRQMWEGDGPRPTAP